MVRSAASLIVVSRWREYGRRHDEFSNLDGQLVEGVRIEAGARRTLSLGVAAGEVFGLLGHNGAGKTTTVNILTTLLEPTRGIAEVAGHSVTADARGVRGAIGYRPENVLFRDEPTSGPDPEGVRTLRQRIVRLNSA